MAQKKPSKKRSLTQRIRHRWYEKGGSNRLLLLLVLLGLGLGAGTVVMSVSSPRQSSSPTTSSQTTATTATLPTNAPVDSATKQLQLQTFIPTATPIPLPTAVPVTTAIVPCAYQGQSSVEQGILASYTVNNNQIKAFYVDEHAVSLGSGAVSPFAADSTGVAGSVLHPSVGDTSVLDGALPVAPSLFLVDQTTGSSLNNGKPYFPNAVYGTWKALGGPDPVTNNNTNLGVAAPDLWPVSAPLAEGHGKPYTAEIIWNISALGIVPSTPYKSYQATFSIHDGDQTQSGDRGIACATILY